MVNDKTYIDPVESAQDTFNKFKFAGDLIPRSTGKDEADIFSSDSQLPSPFSIKNEVIKSHHKHKDNIPYLDLSPLGIGKRPA